MKGFCKLLTVLSVASTLHATDQLCDLVAINAVNPNIKVKLYFASRDNFTHKIFYDESAQAYLRAPAAQALSCVQQELESLGLGLLVVDAYRPVAIQKALWQECPNPKYVIDPVKCSRHNCGMAVDVVLINLVDGSLVGMPTPFFAEESARDYKSMNCSIEAKKNCKLLELIMEKHGYKGLETEWWHFDFQVKTPCMPLDISFGELLLKK